MSDPMTVRGELNDLALALGQQTTELYSLRERFATLAAQYDDLFSDLLVELNEEYARSTKRLPGEDVREALITQKIREQEPDLYGKYRSLKAEIDRKERREQRTKDRLEAKRSELSSLKVEFEATNG